MKQVLLAFLCMIASSGIGHAASISLQPDRWDFRYGKGTPSHPKAEAGGFGFDVPKWSNQIDYLTRKFKDNIKDKTLTLKGTIVASPNVVFRAPAQNCKGSPASFRFVMQKQGDDLTSSDGRFWSQASIRPIAGTNDFTLTTKVSFDFWTNVDGRKNSRGFNKLMNNMGNIGVTMVGPDDCSYGHGLGVAQGSTHMVFKSLTVD